jgi:hypothetical protein
MLGEAAAAAAATVRPRTLLGEAAAALLVNHGTKPCAGCRVHASECDTPAGYASACELIFAVLGRGASLAEAPRFFSGDLHRARCDE